MKWPMAALVVFGLIGCGSADPTDARESAAAVEAPPRSEGDALLTRYSPTKPGAPAPKGPLAPKDECGQLEGSYAFRLALAEAVVKRDADALVNLAAEDILLSFGGDAGRSTLAEWMAGEEGDLVWRELGAILPLGCAAYDDGAIAVPAYWAADLPFDDAFTAAIVMGEDVPLMASPEDGAAELARLSWEPVELTVFMEADAVTAPVRTASGQEGYVATEKLRYYLDYRLLAERRDGEWQMTVLLAGD